MSAGSPRGGKTNTQTVNETTDKAHFYLSSDFKHVKKKHQAWWFSEDWDFSANFSIWMYTWLAAEYWTLYQDNTTSEKNWANTSSLIFLNHQFSQYSNFKSLLSTHTHLQKGYWRGEPKRADSTCIYNYLFLYHSAMSSLCGNLDMPSTCFPDAFD